MSKAILIDVIAREIRMVDLNGALEIRKAIGGWIQAAYQWPSGDVLYCDEEGLLKSPENFFRLPERGDQPLAGNGVIVGPEIIDGDGDFHGNDDVGLTAAGVAARVEFRTKDQVKAWAKANASDVHSAISIQQPDGRWTTEVTSRGEAYEALLKSEQRKRPT